MQLLIVSDSHGERDALEQLRERYTDEVDIMIHCGDSELQADDAALAGYSVVAGNCDLDTCFSEELTVNVNGTNIFVAHGHKHQIYASLLPISLRAKEYEAKYVFFGHTHMLGAEMVDGVLFLNPGSISLPRGGNEKSYAIIEENEKELTVKFFNEKHQELQEMTRVFNR